jgi:hypothetical protein
VTLTPRGALEAILMAPPVRFLIVEVTGDLLLCERRGNEISGHTVSRDQLAASNRRLYEALLAADSVDCPKVVTERR